MVQAAIAIEQSSSSSAAVASAANAAKASSVSTGPAAVSSKDDSSGTLSYDDAYWAQQPAAVQQLRNISDQGQRTGLATELEDQGYQIDVPIMVWGWDPAITMSMRAADGYTWVPAAGQANVTALPGLSGPGITPYNPNYPPPGSITVPQNNGSQTT